MMKSVLYVLPRRDYFSRGDRGSVTHAMGIINGLTANDIKVFVITGGGFEKYKSRLSRPENVGYIEHKASSLKFLWLFGLYFKIMRTIANFQIPIVIIRYSISLPTFQYFLNYGVRARGKKMVLEINSLLANYSDLKGIKRFFKPALMIMEPFIVRSFKYYYVVSKGLADFMVTNGYKGKMIIVPNASDIVPNAVLEKKESKVRLVYLGSLKFYYDLYQLVDAFIELKEKGFDGISELAFYGHGPETKELKIYAQDRKDIVFYGEYDNATVSELINPASDILMLPYKDGTVANFGSPTKLFEYMALKAPVISSNVGQLDEFVVDGVNGLKYNYYNREELVNKIEQLAQDPELRTKLAHHAYNDLMTKHTWKSRMEYLYTQITAVDA